MFGRVLNVWLTYCLGGLTGLGGLKWLTDLLSGGSDWSDWSGCLSVCLSCESDCSD